MTIHKNAHVHQIIFHFLLLLLLLHIVTARTSKLFPCPPLCMCDLITQRVDCSNAGFSLLQFYPPPGTRILIFKGNRFDLLTRSTFNITALSRLRQLSLANNSIIDIERDVLAHQEKIIKLDLSNNLLQGVPSIIGEMRFLKQVDLSFNFITSISESDFPPNSVIDLLYLDHNDIGSVQDGAFRTQKQLRILNLGNNILSNISTGLFSNLPTLLQLDLSYNRIGADLSLQFELLGEEIPTPKTVELDSAADSLTVPPLLNFSDWFSPHGAISLEYLDLSENLIKSIVPNAFILFPELKSVDLSGNQLSDLPPHLLDNVTHIQILSLGRNNLTSLPNDFFSKCNYLMELDLSGNIFRHFTKGLFVGRNNLRTLDLSSNLLQDVEFLAIDLPHLEVLRLSDNVLVEVNSVGFTRLVSLQILNLQNNQLISIPNVKNLTKLRELDLSNNELVAIPNNAFDGTVGLEVISIENNMIVSIGPEPFSGLPNLQFVGATGNAVNCDCRMKWLADFLPGTDYSANSADYSADYNADYSADISVPAEPEAKWMERIMNEVICVKPNIVSGAYVVEALMYSSPDLICSHFASPQSIMILVLTWFLIVVVFLILFWSRTFWVARKQLSTARPKKAKTLKEQKTCYVISTATKKTGNGQYQLLPDKIDNEPLVFLPNHDDDESNKIRTFDRSAEIFIETTV